MTSRPAKRRTVLAAALATAAAAGTPSALAADGGAAARGPRRPKKDDLIDYQDWTSTRDWNAGEHQGTRVRGRRAGIALGSPVGTTEYRDPHTGRTAEWEYATWTSPLHTPKVPATELIASWNARTPSGTWLRIEVLGSYADGTDTPWYTLGIWTAGDGDDVPRRTSVPDQSDGRSTVWTDTVAVDDSGSGVRLAAYRLRVTLCRAPGSDATPTVWRLGAMASDLPDRFEVPASEPGQAGGIELKVPRYSQNIHEGRYPEYDGGGEAWCSPTSSQMIIEYWGRKPAAEDLAWVNPDYEDPQVCHAARFTFDYEYEGCGNWPFNTAYAATYEGMEGVVTRCATLHDAERLVAAGIPLITSQSFIESELDGAGYGTAGHLMTVIGFTEDGDVIANDPASPDNPAVRRVYRRREFENIWLRTKRYNEKGEVRSGTGGVCYIYFPVDPSPAQRRALREFGVC
ncbi:peptidase C39 family protein [Streptomyces sp. N2-109]|uniref:Peptidase C39 family protein n=1 Tax=Streptomyces gossypii TaxID=2883101 RepID=A0ABT2JKU5_9ACTN|nr:peptidase C39 family protein [Streptomyces gossypii]MCT2588508.1 peptidase C39 family protein [Streptomyces gossypii]